MGTFNPATDAFLASSAPLMVNDGYPAPNTFTNGSNAMALDVDAACGQCHETASAKTSPYGLSAPTFVGSIPQFGRPVLAMAAVGMHNSPALAPTFSTPSGSVPSGATTVTITQSQGLSIYYTIDGSQPTIPASGTTIVHASPVTITVPATGTEVIYAMSGGTNGTTVYSNSPIVRANYTVQYLATPQITPGGSSPQNTAPVTGIMMTDNSMYTVNSLVICYTTNGLTPTAATPGTCDLPGVTATEATYSAPITVSTSETIKAIATAPMYLPSGTATAVYTVLPAQPTFASGTAATTCTVSGGTTTGTAVGTCTPTITNGKVTNVSLSSGGTLYTVAPTCTITGLFGSGSGAACTATIGTGGVVSVAITSPVASNEGSGYLAFTQTPGTYFTSGVGVDVQLADTATICYVAHANTGVAPTTTTPTSGVCSGAPTAAYSTPFHLTAPGTWVVEALGTNGANSNVTIGTFRLLN